MRVLLVYPEFPDTYWSFKHALAFQGKRSAFPPLGLLTVSTMLPENWEKRLVDVNIEPLTSKDLCWADIVFLSGMLMQKKSLENVIPRCGQDGSRRRFALHYDSADYRSENARRRNAEIRGRVCFAPLGRGRRDG